MRDTIASQLIGHNFPRFTLMPFDQAFEKALRCLAVTPTLQKDIDDFAVLIHGSPEIVLYAAKLKERKKQRKKKWPG